MKKDIFIILIIIFIFQTNVSFGKNSTNMTKDECDKHRFDFSKFTEVYFPDPYYDEVKNERGENVLKAKGYFVYDDKKIEPLLVSKNCKNIVLKNSEINNFPKMYLISDNGGTTAWSTLKSWFTGAPASPNEGKSLIERLKSATQDGGSFATNQLKTQTGERLALNGNGQLDKLNNALMNTADDRTLASLTAFNLFSKVFVYNTNPSKVIMEPFSSSIIFKSQNYTDPSLQSDKRISCEGGCGNFKASRVNKDGVRYEHDGIDMSTKVGDPIFASNSGVILEESSISGLPLIRIRSSQYDTNYNTSATSYLSPVVKPGQKVEQGELIGYQKDITPSYGNTPTHTHFRIENKDYNFKTNKDFTDPTPLIFRNNKW